MKIFIDTNVWLDFLLERSPFYESAASILSLADDGLISVGISALTAANAHYVCCERAKMDIEVLVHKLSVLQDIVEILSLTSDDVRLAYTMRWNDFEDCLQHNVAVRFAADCIVTRNEKDFALSSIAVYNPETLLRRLSLR